MISDFCVASCRTVSHFCVALCRTT
jgi:hypothetical protein